MDAENPDSQSDEALWHEIRTLYAKGRTARQIARRFGLSPSTISDRAEHERWPAPLPPDWHTIRDAWETGQSDRALAIEYGISATALRKRRIREKWHRGTGRGIDALRLAVRTLEETLEHTDLSDTATTLRLAAALSMAAGRLRDADIGKPDVQDTDTADFKDDADELREHITNMLMRLAGEET